MTHEFTWLKANQLLKIYLILQKIPPKKIQNEPSEMASLSCVKWGAASVTSDRCWFHSVLFCLPLHGKFFRLLWFYCDITDICEIRTVKIKSKQKTLLTLILQKRK